MTKYYRMTVNSKAVPVLRAAVMEKPGQAARDLCAAAGYTYAHGVAVLTILRKAGEIAPVRADGGITLWFPADQAAQQAAKWKAIRKEHTKQRKARNRKANPTTRIDRIQITSPSVVKVLEVIHANPGIQSAKMAELTGCKMSHVKNVLSVIRNAGKAVMIPGGNKTRHWYAAEVAGPFVAEWEAKRRKRGEPKPKAPTKRGQIAEWASHPEGVRMSHIMHMLGIGQNLASRHIGRMVEQGRLFRSQRQGARIRWFNTAEKAQEWAAMPPMEPSEWVAPGRKAWENSDRPRSQKEQIREAAREAREKRQADRLVAIGERIKNSARQPSKPPPKLAGSDQGKYAVIKSKPGVAPPVTIAERKSSQEVDYSRAKITICPAPQYNYRHEYAPGPEAWTGFVREWKQLRGAA